MSRMNDARQSSSKKKRLEHGCRLLRVSVELYNTEELQPGAYSPEVQGVQRTPCDITGTHVNYI